MSSDVLRQRNLLSSKDIFPHSFHISNIINCRSSFNLSATIRVPSTNSTFLFSLRRITSIGPPIQTQTRPRSNALPKTLPRDTLLDDLSTWKANDAQLHPMNRPVIVLRDTESKGKEKAMDATSSGWTADGDESGRFDGAVEEVKIENRGYESDDSATRSKAVSALFMAPCPEHGEFEDSCPACRARTPGISKVLRQKLKVGIRIHDLYARERTPGPSNQRPVSLSKNSEEVMDQISDSYFPNQRSTGERDVTSWTADNPTPIPTPSVNSISSSVHRKATKTLCPHLSDLNYLPHTKHLSACSENKPVAKKLFGEVEGRRFNLRLRIHGEEGEYIVPFEIRVLTTGERPFVTVREPKRWWDWLGRKKARKNRRKLERKELSYNLAD